MKVPSSYFVARRNGQAFITGNSGFPKNTDLFLKPATEFVVFSRRPFDGSAADCYEKHGTAYINIDSCRIEGGERPDRRHDTDERREDSLINRHRDEPTSSIDSSRYADGTTDEGRYPSNLVFDEETADALDEEVGELKSGGTPASRVAFGSDRVYGSATGEQDLDQRVGTNSGGPSRYFYTSKATRAERTLDGQLENDHPTVKPQDLMEWLVKLVTRREQIVLDPFAGSGTTLAAAKGLDRRFIGFEKQARYVSVAQARVGLDVDDPSVFDQPEDQSTVTDF